MSEWRGRRGSRGTIYFNFRDPANWLNRIREIVAGNERDNRLTTCLDSPRTKSMPLCSFTIYPITVGHNELRYIRCIRDIAVDAVDSLPQQQRGPGVHRKSQEKRSSSCHYFASCEKPASHVQVAQLHEGWCSRV